jgi:predicted MPP superfamily phosphohydrolase
MTRKAMRERIIASRTLRHLGFLAVVLVGVAIGLTLASRTEVPIGPFRTTFSVTPSLTGDSEVLLPPLGSLELDTHDGPAHLRVALDGLDRAQTEALITDPAGIQRASRSAVDDFRSGVDRLIVGATGAGMLGAMFAAALVYRRMRKVAWAGGLALVILGASFGTAALTFNPRSLKEPRYEGLLANAPVVVGDAQRLADRYDAYAAQLEKMVVNVSNLYNTVAKLPVYTPDDQTIRVLHVSDLHLNPAAWSVVRSTVEQFHIDVVVDTGDIADWGTDVEASFVASIALLKVPYIYVRGNHDSGITQAAVASQPNAIVLDNGTATVAGLTFAGIGDPRFTPDKAVNPQGASESQATIDQVLNSGRTLAQTVVIAPRPVDIALVHDPRAAEPLAGRVPLVLAGHEHERRTATLVNGPARTRLLVEGSTGGAGLRGLEGEHPRPLEMSILYFDRAREFLATDEITVGGTGLAEVTLKRHLIEPLVAAEPSVSPS